MKVIPGTITSSPGPIPSRRIAAHNAADPLWQGTAAAAPHHFANSSPKFFACGPLTHLPLDSAAIAAFSHSSSQNGFARGMRSMYRRKGSPP